MLKRRAEIYNRRVKVQALKKRCPELSMATIGRRWGVAASIIRQDLAIDLEKSYHKESNKDI